MPLFAICPECEEVIPLTLPLAFASVEDQRIFMNCEGCGVRLVVKPWLVHAEVHELRE